jgi:hypothetical protein
VAGLAALSLTLTSCNRYGFTGHIETIVPATVAGKYGPHVQVTGWVQAKTSTPWRTIITVNGKVPTTPESFPDATTSTPRPQVEALVGGHARGFLAEFDPPARGVYHVCLHVIPLWAHVPKEGDVIGEGSDVVECAWLIQGRDWTERGKIEHFSVAGGVVTVDGWVRYTPDVFKRFGVLADRQLQEPLTSQTTTRHDIDSKYGDGTIGFHLTYPADPTASRWCLSTFSGDEPSSFSVDAELDCVDNP